MSTPVHPARWALLLALAAVPAGCTTLHKHGCGAGPHVQPCPWAGIYPTVVTPFCDHGIDVKSLECQIHYELASGVQGLLLLGTIGEGQYVNFEERAQVITTAVQAVHGAVPIVVGIHCGDIDTAQAQLLQAKALGASAVLVKYLGHPHAPGPEVLGFIAALDELHALPIFYYHYPSQTGLYLSPGDIAAILGLPGVVGIKESTLDLKETKDHIALTCGQGKVFLSGTALNLTQFMDLGGNGAMCAEAVVMPGPTVHAYHAYLAGNHEEARAIQKELFVDLPILKDRSPPVPLARALFMTAQDHCHKLSMGHDHPQARIKAALNCLGVPTSPAVKCPLPPLTKRDDQKVRKAVKAMKAIDWCGVCLQVPPVPLHVCPCENGEDGGMFLQTGALQLGPGVGRDMLRTAGDSAWGF
jgi:4-hydroxy-tetrahydrodipicolinate synthase